MLTTLRPTCWTATKRSSLWAKKSDFHPETSACMRQARSLLYTVSDTWTINRRASLPRDASCGWSFFLSFGQGTPWGLRVAVFCMTTLYPFAFSSERSFLCAVLSLNFSVAKQYVGLLTLVALCWKEARSHCSRPRVPCPLTPGLLPLTLGPGIACSKRMESVLLRLCFLFS